MTLVEAVDLCKDYVSDAGLVPALYNISLSIHAGEFVAIMGPSGSGKSTLMNLLGLLDTPTKGTLSLAGKDVTKFDADARARIRNTEIGFVFQSYNLLPRLTAQENVELPLVYAGVPRNERCRRAREALDSVGLTKRYLHWPNRLSGGEQQRVAIARAMVTLPAIVLADEPTGALDSDTGNRVMRHFRQMADEFGTAVVIVTHDKAVAAHAQRTIHLADGQMISEPVSGLNTHAGFPERNKAAK